jgi:hypothetical protein
MRARVGLLAAALALAPGGAAAQPSAADKATAQVLFEAGRDLKKEGRFDEACPKLEESQRLDPQLGTLLNLADCWANMGRTASAWVSFVELAGAAHRAGDPREEVARERAAELEPKLTKLRIVVRDAADGLEVRRDGDVVREPSWGEALPVDPGDHLVVASAPGHAKWQTTVAVDGAGDVVELVVPPLERATTPDPEPPPPSTGGGIPAQAIAGWVVGGAGVVGVAVGIGFAVLTKTNNDESLEHCPTDPNLCDAEGVALRDEARSDQTISIVAFVLGGVALVTGAVLVATAPSESAQAWRIGPDGASLRF